MARGRKKGSTKAAWMKDQPCNIFGCKGKVVGNGACTKHFRSGECSVEGCTDGASRRGKCTKHYFQLYRKQRRELRTPFHTARDNVGEESPTYDASFCSPSEGEESLTEKEAPDYISRSDLLFEEVGKKWEIQTHPRTPVLEMDGSPFEVLT